MGASSASGLILSIIGKPRPTDNTSPDCEDALVTMRPRLAQIVVAIVLSVAWLAITLMLGPTTRFEGSQRIAFELVWGSPILFSLNSLRRRVRLSDDAIELFSQWFGKRKIAWGDVYRVKFVEWGQTIRLYPKRGLPIVIPVTLTGIPELERLLREKAPQIECDAEFGKYRSFIATL